MPAMTLALDVFLRLRARRDELRRSKSNNPVDKIELETLEEIVKALVGSDGERALEAYIERLSAPTPEPSLH